MENVRFAFISAVIMVAGVAAGQDNSSGANQNYQSGVKMSSIAGRSSLRATPAPKKTGTPTPTPAPGAAAPAGKPGARTPNPSQKIVSKSGGTTGTLGSRRPGGSGANAPTGIGNVKLVTKGLVESVKTQKLDYNEDDMADNPNVIILNSRKFKPEESLIERQETAKRSTSHNAATSVDAKPL
ncbi:MAG: hypothetical protein K1X53_16265 [Candidatus Sumerlaeaceae bacterium]|nr:hypothetical protein [Candidatus Sumerlaeaceae bacterium]